MTVEPNFVAVSKLPAELREEHDRIMAMPPIEYRGYLIKPVSHRFRPYYIRGEYVYWCWIVSRDGCNDGPGATCGTIGQMKTVIDCMHEAGPHPPCLSHWAETVEAMRANGEELDAWNKRFWAFIRDREMPR